MMVTILTLIVLGMIFQGVVAVLDSILDTAGVNGMLKGLPIIGPNLNLIWAWLFVVISDIADMDYGVSTEVLGIDSSIGTAIAICAFIPVGNAAISALGKGVAR